MKKAPKTFASGDLVFAKVRGYPPWPARVTSPADKNNTKFHVFFYGTYETAVCKKEELWIYDASTRAKFGRQKRKMFPEALDEIENRPEIAEAALANGPPATKEPQTPGDAGTPVTSEAVETPTTTGKAAVKPVRMASLEEDHEEHALVIDEDSNKSVRNRGSKRKAEESPSTPSQPPTKQLRVKLTSADIVPSALANAKPMMSIRPITPSSQLSTPPIDEKMSRSGRVIKPKKFVDESPENSPQPKKEEAPVTSSMTSSGVEPKEIFAHVKQTGDIIKLNLDKDRPKKFDSKEEEENWEKASARNAISFKQIVESGKVIPIEVKKKLEQKENRNQIENEILEKEKFVARKNEKIRWLRVEQKLCDLDIELKKSVNFQKPKMELCIQYLKELQTLAISQFMLKKQHTIVQTVRMLQKYCGPAMKPTDPKVAEKWLRLSEVIRRESTKVYSKMRSLFPLPDGKKFYETFEVQVRSFQEATNDYPLEKLLYLVKDPTA